MTNENPVEEFPIPEMPLMRLRLALMSHDRDKALQAGAQARKAEAEAVLTGLVSQLARSEAEVKSANDALGALLTEGGRYEVEQPIALEAVTVKRRRAPDASAVEAAPRNGAKPPQKRV